MSAPAVGTRIDVVIAAGGPWSAELFRRGSVSATPRLRELEDTRTTPARPRLATDTHARVLVEDGRIVCEELHALLLPSLEERILPYVRARYAMPWTMQGLSPPDFSRSSK